MDTVFIMRHGEKEYDNGRGKGNMPIFDPPLTRDAMTKIYENIKPITNYKIRRIITSPLKRCRQTAICVKSLTNAEIMIDLAISEYLGNWIERRHKYDSNRWFDQTMPIKGEAVDDLFEPTFEHFGERIDKLVEMIKKGAYNNCCLVTHSVVIEGIYARMFGNDKRENKKFEEARIYKLTKTENGYIFQPLMNQTQIQSVAELTEKLESINLSNPKMFPPLPTSSVSNITNVMGNNDKYVPPQRRNSDSKKKTSVINITQSNYCIIMSKYDPDMYEELSSDKNILLLNNKAIPTEIRDTIQKGVELAFKDPQEDTIIFAFIAKTFENCFNKLFELNQNYPDIISFDGHLDNISSIIVDSVRFISLHFT